MTNKFRVSFFFGPLARSFGLSVTKPLAMLATTVCLALAGPSAQAQQLTPAQMAYYRTETRKADDAFAKDVAKIVDVRTSVVTKLMPERGRIADPVARLISALERNLGKPLSDEQKAAIQTADVDRQKYVEHVGKVAATR
jgi:hypothetical protein